MTQCSLIRGYRDLGGTYEYSLHLQGRRWRYYLKMEVTIYHTIPRDRSGTARYLLHTSFIRNLYFDPEDGADMFIRNVSWLSMDYAALYPSRQKSSGRFYFAKSTVQNFVLSGMTSLCDVWSVSEGMELRYPSRILRLWVQRVVPNFWLLPSIQELIMEVQEGSGTECL
jgi:hypothetical protein